MNIPETIRLEADAVCILDQTLLPTVEKYIRLVNIEQVHEAIKYLRVRGAPAIGIAAAMGMYIHMKNVLKDKTNFSAGSIEIFDEFLAEFDKGAGYLASSRPTAVNLTFAINLLREEILVNSRKPLEFIIISLQKKAEEILTNDTNVCRTIGEYGAELIKANMGILTHCNAGSLATSKYGTALAPMYLAKERGISFHVYADETRPLLQGTRLTAFELSRAGIDVTLLCDNMAASLMSQGKIDLIFVGCDRVAANGDTANKIGTLGLAVLAKYYKIPFYVCVPYSTFDPATPNGTAIPIEERDGDEVTTFMYKERLAPERIKVYNPAFDVTPAELITAFVTEKGIKRAFELWENYQVQSTVIDTW